MSLKIFAIVSLALGSLVLNAPAGTLALDGLAIGPVGKWSGGDARATVVTGSSGGKQLGAPFYDPVVVEVPLPLQATLVTWINDFAAGRRVAKNLVLTETDAPGRASSMVTTLQATGAYLTAVRFPPGDALSRTGAMVVLEIGVGQGQLTVNPAQSGTQSAPARTSATVQHFRLNVGNLGPTGIIKTGIIELKGAPSGGLGGNAIVTSAAMGATQLSTLTVTLADTAVAAWRTWFTDFVINGNNDNAREKSGSLEFLAADQTTVALRLELTQVGIARLTRQAATDVTAATSEVEIYFEQLAIGAGAAPATQTSQTQPAPAPAPAPADPVPAAAPPAAGSSTTASSPAPVAPVAASGPLPGTIRTPVGDRANVPVRPGSSILPPVSTRAVVTPPSSNPTLPNGAMEVTNDADEGSRDPIDFPRATGLVRQTFSGSRQQSYLRETATYTSADELRQVLDRVSKAAQAGGWEQTSLTETGNKAAGRVVNAEWVKGSIRAQINLADRKPEGVTLTLWVAGEKSGG